MPPQVFTARHHGSWERKKHLRFLSAAQFGSEPFLGSGCVELKPMRIVITGAPSSGKSSVIAELQKRRRPGWVMMPESAVVLLSGGYPAPAHDDLNQTLSFQQIILHTQTSLEKIFAQRELLAAKYVHI